MNQQDSKWDEKKWRIMRRRLRYSDEEMELFQNSPRNEDVLNKSPELMNKEIIIEVVESHGCNSQHGVEYRFHFDGFTSTSRGIKESFLPQFGHFPSSFCMISSGGFKSLPSYKTCLHS